MKVQSGKLNKRIEIQREIITGRSENGAGIRKWEKHKEVWAKINPISSREPAAAGIEFNEIFHQIKIRYLVGINSKMRIKYNDRFFEIAGIRNLNESDRMLIMNCREIKDREIT